MHMWIEEYSVADKEREAKLGREVDWVRKLERETWIEEMLFVSNTPLTPKSTNHE